LADYDQQGAIIDLKQTSPRSYPVPGEDTFYSNDNILTKGSDGFEEGITVSFHVAMFFDFSFFIDDSDIHFSCA